MTKIIEGIVLKNSDFKEKSKIIQCLTKEHGLIGIYIKGANDYKNKNFLLAQPITHALFNINYNNNGLSNSFTGDLLNSFSYLKSDFSKNIYVFQLFELILKCFEQHIPVPYLYDLLLMIINEINNTHDKAYHETLTMLFECKLLYFLGISPQIDNCVGCSTTQKIVNFDINQGGFVCTKCFDHRSRQFSLDTLTLIRELYYFDINNINILNIPKENLLKELRTLLTDYYFIHLGIKTNSLKFF